MKKTDMNKIVSSLQAAIRVLSKSEPVSASLDPRKAMVYFDISFEDYNFEEDRDSDDRRSRATADEFLSLGRGDEAKAASKAEDLMAKEIAKLLKKFRLNVRLLNEGYDRAGNLVMKFGVDSVDDVQKLIDMVSRNHGGGDDVIYSSDVPYMSAQGFTLYPNGVNKGSVRFDDMEDWVEENA